MRARLLPLEGKYYGTKIEIIDDDGFDFEIELWNPGNFEPSDRELRGCCTIEQWRNNEILPNERDSWTVEYGVRARDLVSIEDTNFESRTTHRMALKIIDLINNCKTEKRLK